MSNGSTGQEQEKTAELETGRDTGSEGGQSESRIDEKPRMRACADVSVTWSFLSREVSLTLSHHHSLFSVFDLHTYCPEWGNVIFLIHLFHSTLLGSNSCTAIRHREEGRVRGERARYISVNSRTSARARSRAQHCKKMCVRGGRLQRW